MNPDREEKILRAVGLCRKAGKLLIGTDTVCAALAGRQKPFAVLTAADNSEKTDKKLRDKCGFYGVERTTLPVSGERLAHAVGKSAHCAAVAVTDANLYGLVRSTLTEPDEIV